MIPKRKHPSTKPFSIICYWGTYEMKTAFIRLLNLIFIFLFHFSIYGQCEELGVPLHQCRVDEVMKNCNGWSSIQQIPKNAEVLCLHIYNKQDFDYFLKNIHLFSELRALSVIKVKISDFEFLKDLKKLEFLSLQMNKNYHLESFVSKVNSSKIHLLELKNVNTEKKMMFINQLSKIKSIHIKNSKLKKLKIDLALEELVVSHSPKIKSIEVNNTINLELYDNEYKLIPKGLEKSNKLKRLSFSQFRKLKIKNPIIGFENLELLDLFSTPSDYVDKTYFVNNNKVEIYLNSEWNAKLNP
jgi:hypothetical protein